MPLIAHTVAAARRARRVDRVVVTTDDRRIANAARRAGAEVPFLRPANLATDSAPTIDAVLHAVEELERGGERFGIVVTLQPTSPLRGPKEIDEVLALLDDPDVGSAVTVTPLEIASSVVGTLRAGRFAPLAATTDEVRRQASTGLVRLTGAVYATRRDVLDSHRLLDDAPAVLVTNGPAAIDIDDREGLLAARRALRRSG